MTIAPPILQEFAAMNAAQRSIVEHDEGPLLVIAGPGSGKTFSLVLRAINLLLQGKTAPRELVICTFTEKAAFELRDRIASAARKVGYAGDLSELRVSTIHGLCNRIITTYRHLTPLGNNYETLDELTQLLFIFENFDEIIGEAIGGLYLGKWKTKWTTIEGIRNYFDKITEELIDPAQLHESQDPFLIALGKAYEVYRATLFSQNRLDFAHQQKLLHDLLLNSSVAEKVIRGVKYIMVDEYQDTNYIQEQIVLKLAGTAANLCVVGDEDQSLYRFRGGTVGRAKNFLSNGICLVKQLRYRFLDRIVFISHPSELGKLWSIHRYLPPPHLQT